MSRDKLVIEDEHGGWIVAWLVSTDDGDAELGAYLGDGKIQSQREVDAALATAQTADDYDTLEHAVATRGAIEVVDRLDEERVERRDDGFYFTRQSDARAARAAAALAVKALRARAKQVGDPWPLWALTAKAAGWSPPKGWKP